MIDDFQSPAWATHHNAFSSAVHKAIRDFASGMKRLNDQQFDAPWRRRPPVGRQPAR